MLIVRLLYVRILVNDKYMSGIKEQMTKGVMWTALDKYSGFFSTLITSMVLARLLSPYEFGIVATASVLLAFLTIFTNIGLAPAIIQRKDLDLDDYNKIFTFTILMGFVMGGISFCSSWYIANFYNDKLLIPIVQVLSVGLFLSSINIVPAALMAKNFRFREMATRSIAFKVIFGIIGVVSAFYGAGVYALIFPQILASLCTFFYNNHFYKVRIAKNFNLDPIKKIFSYSVYVFLSQVTNYFSRNLDKIFIGKILSAGALGYYDKSYRLMQLPMGYITSVITPVIQPIMSNLQDNMRAMAMNYTKIIKLIASLSFPVAVILYFSADEVMTVLFGEQWLPAVPSFQILALSIPISLICSPNGAMYQACNGTKPMFYFTLFGTLVIVLSFAIAAYCVGTIESFAWAWTINELISAICSYYILFNVVMKQSLMPVFKSLFLPSISALLMTIIYILYDISVPIISVPIVSLVLKMVIGVVFIFAFLAYTKQFNLFNYIKTKIQKNSNNV